MTPKYKKKVQWGFKWLLPSSSNKKRALTPTGKIQYPGLEWNFRNLPVNPLSWTEQKLKTPRKPSWRKSSGIFY